MTTKRMKESQIADVSNLLRESYAWLGEREGLSHAQIDFLVSERGSVECVRRESKIEDYLVAQDGDKIVGMAAVSANTITKLYVHPAHMGMGIGRQLYEAAEAIITTAGHTRVVLGAFRSAVPFYEQMGLQVVGFKQPTGPLTGMVVTLMEKTIGEPAA